jgi:putative addiction module killer protein
MIALRKTPEFVNWLDDLRDRQAKRRIQARIDLLEEGYAGDHKAVGEGLFEMRIHCGPGYRVYFKRQGSTIVIVLAGGDKNSQDKDIRLALRLSREL